MLTPAAIERKLRVTATGRGREQDLDADELAQQCVRLVILGGPGAGKTWLAKRTARRWAENALQVLAAGGTLEEAELPLYTTCSRLFGADGDIREAVVSSALGQLGDLGGSRISKALGVFFAERNAPTLLVIDSLDEAHGPSERLRQASTLPWRIVLTSRPSSWKNQLTVNDTDESHRVGELQPLGEADAGAVDHVATPLGPPDVDTGMTLRRFIHRSVRELLVTGHVASLPVDQAVKVLLPHLWYDPDWEYAAPAAVAMHPPARPAVAGLDLPCREFGSDSRGPFCHRRWVAGPGTPRPGSRRVQRV